MQIRWWRKRTAPSVTELCRVERVLESDQALRLHLGLKTTPVRKRNGQVILFSELVVAVAEILMATGASPERTHVRKVLMAAVAVLRSSRGSEQPPACE